MLQLKPCILFIFCWGLGTVASAKSMSEEKLGEYSAKVAANLLSQNAADKDGQLLHALAERLSPNGDTVLLNQALIKRGKPLIPAKTKATKQRLIKAFVDRGDYWYEKDHKKDTEARYMIHLYYMAADKLCNGEPTKEVLIAFNKLTKLGYETTLDKLLKEGKNALLTDADFEVPMHLAANPVRSQNFDDTEGVVYRNRKGPRGPRGGKVYKSDNATVQLKGLELVPPPEDNKVPSRASLMFSWELEKPIPCIFHGVESPLMIDNDNRSLIAKTDYYPPMTYDGEPIAVGDVEYPFLYPDLTADRIRQFKGILKLYTAKTDATIIQKLPVTKPVTNGGFTIIFYPATPGVMIFEVEYKGNDTDPIPPGAIYNALNVTVLFSGDSEFTAKHGEGTIAADHFKKNLTCSYNRSWKPLELRITYPSELESIEFPFEFRNIGLPDTAGRFQY